MSSQTKLPRQGKSEFIYRYCEYEKRWMEMTKAFKKQCAKCDKRNDCPHVVINR